MRSSQDKRTTQNIPRASPPPALTTPPALAQVLIVVVIVELLLSSSPSLTTLISVSPGIVRIPHARFRPSPFTNPPSTSAHPPAALRPLCTSSLGRQTNRQTDGHTVRQTSSRKLRKPGSSSRSNKSATLSDSVTRPLASCNILCNTIPQLAHAILCYTRS